MSEPSIEYTAGGGIARLVIDQPAKMNAMTFGMWTGLAEMVHRAEQDAEVRAISLEGAGDKAFCAGADISQFGEKRTGEAAVAAYETAVSAGMNALLAAEKPTIAIIRGICFGGGFALAMCCDLRFATSDSRFRVPAARLGLGYASSNIAMLVAKLGLAAVSDVLLSARILDAVEAARLGVASQVHPRGDAFESAVATYLKQLAGNAPLTLRAVKLALIELAKRDGERDFTATDAAVAACFRSADYKEGQAAFREKRDPAFRGS